VSSSVDSASVIADSVLSLCAGVSVLSTVYSASSELLDVSVSVCAASVSALSPLLLDIDVVLLESVLEAPFSWVFSSSYSRGLLRYESNSSLVVDSFGFSDSVAPSADVSGGVSSCACSVRSQSPCVTRRARRQMRLAAKPVAEQRYRDEFLIFIHKQRRSYALRRRLKARRLSRGAFSFPRLCLL